MPLPKPLLKPEAKMSPLRQETLRIAKSYMGIREIPAGSNDAPQLRPFFAWWPGWVIGWPWCALFASRCIALAAKKLKVKPQFRSSISSSQIYAQAYHDGRLLRSPEPGCIGLVPAGPKARQQGKTFEHTFLVHTVDWARGKVITVEGNWGNRVKWNRRPVTGLVYVRIQ